MMSGVAKGEDACPGCAYCASRRTANNLSVRATPQLALISADSTAAPAPLPSPGWVTLLRSDSQFQENGEGEREGEMGLPLEALL